MSWTMLHDSNAIKLLQKLTTLQLKMVELVAKQKYSNMQMKLSMIRAYQKKDEKKDEKNDGSESTRD